MLYELDLRTVFPGIPREFRDVHIYGNFIIGESLAIRGAQNPRVEIYVSGMHKTRENLRIQ